MSVIREWLWPRWRASVPNPGDDRYYDQYYDRYYDNTRDAGVWSGSGIIVSPEQALRIITVFACVRVISETLASLPLTIYERAPDDPRKKEEARDHPLWLLFHYRPNEWQTPYEFIEMLTGHAALRGNGFARIVPGPSGAVDQLIPLHPGRMSIRQDVNTLRISYVYRDLGGKTSTYLQEEILHIRGFGSDGIAGLSPIVMARDALGLSAAAEAYGSRFFSGYARPGGVLEHPGKLGKEARERLRSQWQELHAGLHNAHKVAVLEEGIKWHQVGLTAEDAQFLETRKYQRSEIASLWRVPQHKVGIMDNATFTNIEHQGIEFVTDTMLAWARRWETAILGSLITEPDLFFPKFKLGGLLRGDTQARYAAYATALTSGWMSRNEVRELEDYNPIDGGDEYQQALNMAPVGATPPDIKKQQDRPKGALPESPALRAFVADAADRIANHEIRELMKRTAKMGERKKFVAWVETFYNTTHREYVARVLAPFGAANGAVEAIVVEGRDAWRADEVPELPLWSAARPIQICHSIEQHYQPEGVHHGQD